MPIKIPTVQTGLEASIQAAAKKAGRNLKINMGGNAKSIEGLSQPLGRITGKADQFTKSMEAANARVLAFGASVGILSAVTRGFKELVLTTIEVEKSLVSINSILGGSKKELEAFSKTIFDVARNTEQSFAAVSTAALELTRQGLTAVEVQKRLSDSLILSRLSGLGATEAVSGLTAAINSFNKAGLSSGQVLNKLSAAAVSAAVSERDLIEGIKRAGSVANLAGVSFDELVGVITAVQVKTARGGAVIGNSFKTIFTRIQSIDKLETMQNLGVQVTDTSGKVLGATKLIQNLSKVLAELPEAKRLQIAEGLVGKFQIAPFLAILDDYNSKTSKAIAITEVSRQATSQAYDRNIALNQTLSTAINQATISLKELGDTLGRIGVTDNLKNLLGFFNTLVESVKGKLDGEGAGGDFAKGIVKGIGAVISGPGLAMVGAIILKLGIDLAKFGIGSLKTFFGLNRAAREQATLQGQIASTLLGNKSVQEQILSIENSSLSAEKKKVKQTKFFTTAIKEQLAVMRKMQGIAMKVAPGVRAATKGGRAAGGFIPNYNAIAGYGSESSDISKGVGGAPTSARPVTIPNFNFGGGQKGTMVANSSEYVVPNYAGSGGSAIFNQDMVSSMGMPAGARKISAAGGYIPNYADVPAAFSKYVRQRIPSAFASGNFKSSVAANSLNVVSSQGQMRNLYQSSSLRTDFNKLSPTALRALKVTSRQTAVTGKGTEHMSSYGLLYPDAKGGALAQTITHQKKRIRTIPVATKPSDTLYKEVRKSLVSAASKYAQKLGFNPDIIKEKKFQQSVDRNLNEGSVEGAFGTVFEAAFQGAIGTDQKSNVRWDLRNRASIDTLLSKISSKGLLSKTVGPELQLLQKADFKNTLSSSNLNSVVAKIKASPFKAPPVSKAGKASGGYIPNFANPLQDAIGREQAAGLPVNQIRINQSPKLRNAGNPMGLAVTNTRDEPTGAIPNFALSQKQIAAGFGGKAAMQAQKQNTEALKKSTSQIEKNKGGQRDMLGGIFAVQIGMSALSGATSDAEGGFMRFANRLTTMGSSLTTAAFAGSAINDFGKSIGGKGGGIISKLGLFGAALGGLSAIVKFGSNIYEDMSGITDNTKTGIAALGDASEAAARKLQGLSQIEQKELTDEANRLVGSSKGAKVRADLSSKIQSPGVMVEQATTDYTPFGSGATSTPYGLKTLGIQRQTLGFEGSKTKDIISAAIAEARAGGRSLESVEKELARLGMRQKGGEDIKEGEEGFRFRIDAEELALFSVFLKDTNQLIPELKKKLEGINLSDLSLPPGVQGPTTDGISILAKELGMDESVVREVVEKQQVEQKEKADLKIGEDKEKAQRINASIAKQQIQLAVDLAKIDKTLLDQMDQRILKAELGKTLSEGDLIALKTEREVLNANVGLRNKTLDVVANMSKASKELTFKEKASKELQELIAEASKKTNFTQTERSNLIAKTNKLLEESDKSIKDTLGKEIDSLKVSKETTADTIKRLEALGLIKEKVSAINQLTNSLDIKAKGRFRKESFDESESAARAISGRELNRLNRSRGAQTTLGGERLAKQAARDAVLDSRSNATIQSANLKNRQKDGATNLIEKLLSDAAIGKLAEDKRFDQGSFVSAGNVVDQLGTGILKEAQNLALNEQDRAEIGEFIQQIEDQNSALKRQSEATIKNAEANEKAAGFFQQSAAQLSQDLATELRRGAKKGAIDAKMVVDPAERKKALLSERSRGARANAIANQNFEEFRRLVEEDQFSGKLIDASAQFAQNIGDAMIQAIAQGKSLSDLLLGAASGFFNTLSQAFMQKAVGNIMSGFNAGGKVRGGSGNRDDVPALLTGGEFVMKKSSVNKYGSSFMASLNAGEIPAMARGGLFTPGTYGQEEIKGKSNLLDFATQSHTTGAFDKFRSGSGFASVNLEPQSAALTMFGRRNSPAFQREQASKEEAFGLFTQQANKDKELKEQKKQATKGLLGSIASSLFAFGFSSLTDKFSKNATGGAIPNAAGVDTVPSMLSGGEFVMNAAATQKIGRGNLNALNSGAGGGSGDVVSKLDELISVSDNTGETVINITVNSDGSSDSQGNGDDQQKSLATKIKDVVKQVIDDEKRLGGSLRQSRA
jgi:TP901 family phage tail tape measure protein